MATASKIEPDAHLISAAPDLLRQLKAVQWAGRHAWGYSVCPSCRSPKSKHAPGCTLAAAIAKAEGKQ